MLNISAADAIQGVANGMAASTLLLLILPKPGNCPECVPGKFYAIVYGMIHAFANLKVRPPATPEVKESHSLTVEDGQLVKRDSKEEVRVGPAPKA